MRSLSKKHSQAKMPCRPNRLHRRLRQRFPQYLLMRCLAIAESLVERLLRSRKTPVLMC